MAPCITNWSYEEICAIASEKGGDGAAIWDEATNEFVAVDDTGTELQRLCLISPQQITRVGNVGTLLITDRIFDVPAGNVPTAGQVFAHPTIAPFQNDCTQDIYVRVHMAFDGSATADGVLGLRSMLLLDSAPVSLPDGGIMEFCFSPFCDVNNDLVWRISNVPPGAHVLSWESVVAVTNNLAGFAAVSSTTVEIVRNGKTQVCV